MSHGRLDLSLRWCAGLLAGAFCLISGAASALSTTDGQTPTNIVFAYPSLSFDYQDNDGVTQHWTGNALDYMTEPKLRAFIGTFPSTHGVHEKVRELAGVYGSLSKLQAFVGEEQGIAPSCSNTASTIVGTNADGTKVYQTLQPLWCLSGLITSTSTAKITGNLYTDMSGDVPYRCTMTSQSISGTGVKRYIWPATANQTAVDVATWYRNVFSCKLWDGNFSTYLTGLQSTYTDIFGIQCVTGSGGVLDGCASPSVSRVMASFSAADVSSSNPPDLFAPIDLNLPPPTDTGTGGTGDTGSGTGDTGTGDTGTPTGPVCTDVQIASGFADVGGECRYQYSSTCYFDTDMVSHCTDTGGGTGGTGDTGTGGTGDTGTGGTGDTGSGTGDTGGGTGGTGDTGTGAETGSGWGDAAAIEVTQIAIPLFSTGTGWLPRSCPPPQSLTLLGKSHSLSFEPACQGLSYLSFIFLALAFLKAAGIVFASRQV